MNEVLVSVIIPLYNNEKYILDCIRSVINQSYKNVEIIVVDDGSTDGGKKIVEGINSDKITLFTQVNGGPSKARNKGIELCKGDWILFLDSDDCITTNAIKLLLEQLKNTSELDLIISGWEGIYNKKNIYYGPNTECILSDGKVELLGNYLLSSCVKKINSNIEVKSIEGPVAKLYSSKIIKENKIKFPENLKYAEDVCFNYNYLQYCKKIKLIPNIIYRASRHSDSLSNSYKKLMCLSENFEKNIVESNINNWNIQNNIIYRYLYWSLNDIECAISVSYKDFKDEFIKSKKHNFYLVEKKYLSTFKKIELFILKLNKPLAYILFKILKKIKKIRRR